jgi:hypothetical protein
MSSSEPFGLTPEQKARAGIYQLAVGWDVCDLKQANIHANGDVATRNFALGRRSTQRRTAAPLELKPGYRRQLCDGRAL